MLTQITDSVGLATAVGLDRAISQYAKASATTPTDVGLQAALHAIKGTR